MTYHYWFLDAVLPLLRKEEIALELLVDNEGNTDHLVRSGEVFGAVSSQQNPPNGCHSEPLGSLRYRCVATKDFVGKYFENGINKKNLLSAPYIDFDREDTLHSEYLEKYFGIVDSSAPFFRIPSPKGFLQLTLGGAAYSLIPEVDVQSYVERGRLVDLTPRKTIERPLYWHSWYTKPELYQRVSEAIIDYANKNLA